MTTGLYAAVMQPQATSAEEAMTAIRGLAVLAEKASTFEEWERIFWMTFDIAHAAGLEMTVSHSIDTEALAESRKCQVEDSILRSSRTQMRRGRPA